jgi:DNA-binding MarR family transcriptional regulator
LGACGGRGRGGASSLYDLKTWLEINPGAISHAVERLTKRGALSREDEGYRRKRKLSVTEEGRRILREHWQSVLNERLDEGESLARAIWLIQVMGRTRAHQSGAPLLREKADKIEKSIRKTNPPRLSPDRQLDVIETYRWIKSVTENHRARAVTDSLREIADFVANLPDVEP